MKTTWNNKLGPRSCRAWCILVTADGAIHRFTGSPILSVCSCVETGREKNGKWSWQEFEISHAATTVVVAWRDDWQWEAGYFWTAERAPLANRAAFEAFVREMAPRQAERWDAVAKAVEEFGFEATPEEVAAIQAAQEKIAAEKAAYESAEAERRANSPFAVLLRRGDDG